MSSFLYKVGTWCARHAWRVLGAWLAIIALLGGSVALAGMNLSAVFTINQAESMDGIDMLTERLPQAAGLADQVLFTAESGNVETYREGVASFIAQAENLPGVELVTDPFSTLTPGVSEDGAHAILQVQCSTDIATPINPQSDEALTLATQLDEVRDNVERDFPGLAVELSGNIGKTVDVGISVIELIGVGIALIVLFFTFSSLITAGAPIISAFIGVGAGILVILLAATAIEINSVTPVLAVMIGLAVGIDYALFIISRAREFLAQGLNSVEAAGRADATAGSAVVFAGGTVIVALCGLSVAQIPFLSIMGASAAFVVGVAVLVALTVVPALLRILGERARPKVKAGGETSAQRHSRRTWSQRWVRVVTAKPILTILAVILALGACALPARSMHLGFPDAGYSAKGTELRSTYDHIAEAYGEGFNSPIIVIADISQSSDPLGTTEELSKRLEDFPDVSSVALATPNEDATIALVQILPEKSQADDSTVELVEAIRASAGDFERDLGIRDVIVTGQAAVAIDIAEQLNAALLPFGIVVVGLSLILLLIVFRSIAVPLTATVGYLLSLGAAFGAVGLVFGEGIGAELLSVTRVGIVISFLPVIVMGVLFGLAMDYEVFLVSRMREEWIHTHDAQGAVRRGFVGSAKVVTAAAIIMTAVFAAFIPHGSVEIKPIALALTVGIAADAFLVRMMLIPALMALLGKSAWWIPAWLDRLLPVVDVEGEGLARALEHEAWEAEHGHVAVRMENVRVKEGEDFAFTNANLTLAPGQLALVRSDVTYSRLAFQAVLSGRLRPRRGKVVVGGHVLPDGTSAVQATTAVVNAWDDPIAPHATLVLIDNPGGRRLKLAATLLAQGRTVIITGPTSFTLPDDLPAATQITLTTDDERGPARSLVPTPPAGAERKN